MTTPKYGQELPSKVEKALDEYIARIKAIKWFQPSPDIKREDVDTKVKAALSAFGVESSIEYRQLKTAEDWVTARDAAWGAAWGAAWSAAWDVALGAAWDAVWDTTRGAQNTLASFTETYSKDTPFLKLIDIWEMGLYPVGMVGGRFIVYVPHQVFHRFQEKQELEVIINGITYVPKREN